MTDRRSPWDGVVPGIDFNPRPGFYRARRSAKHPYSAVRIFVPCPMDPHYGEPLDRPRLLSATVNGRPISPHYVWSWCADKPISVEEFDYLTHLGTLPGQPEATPERRIDLGSMAPVYQRRS